MPALRTPPASSPAARKRMQANRGRDTKPELLIRRTLHAMGLRYRVDRRPIPGIRRRADLVFAGARVAVFVDGCFWHACPVHGTKPKENAGYWTAKLLENVARDRDTDRALEAAGWLPIRVWEHEEPAEAAAKIADEVRGRVQG